VRNLREVPQPANAPQTPAERLRSGHRFTHKSRGDPKVNWVLDADIRGFYDAIDHGWMLEFLEHRIADRRMLRLIRKWLKAGVIEKGKWSQTEHGAAQGASVTAPTQSRTSSSSGRFGALAEGICREV
jgi:hypothetical protein